VSDDLIKILDGNTFVISDGRGDIEASPTDPTEGSIPASASRSVNAMSLSCDPASV